MKSHDHMQYFPITAEESAFITRHSEAITNRKFVPNPEKSTTHQMQKRLAIYRAALSDLKHILQSPGTASKTKIGKLLKHMRNSERLLLMRMRPTLIDNFHDLKYILSEFIPLEDRLLFTLGKMNLLFHPDTTICEQQVADISHLIPWQDVEKFYKAAARIMENMQSAAKPSPHEPEFTHADYFNSTVILSAFGSFCSLLDFSPAWKYASFVLALGCAAAGYMDLHERKPGEITANSSKFAGSFWKRPEPAESEQNPPRFARKLTAN